MISNHDAVVSILEQALERVRAGHVTGIGVIEVVRVGDHDWGTNISYQGPQLCLLAGCQQLSFTINEGLLRKLTT